MGALLVWPLHASPTPLKTRRIRTLHQCKDMAITHAAIIQRVLVAKIEPTTMKDAKILRENRRSAAMRFLPNVFVMVAAQLG